MKGNQFTTRTIAFNFYNNKGLISRGIKHVTRGRISHMSVSTENYTYEAIAGRFSKPWVVQRADTPMSNHKKINKEFWSYEIRVSESEYDQVENFLESILFHRYSVLDVLGFLLRWIPQRKGWYCSELMKPIWKILTGDEHVNNRLAPKEAWLMARALKLGDRRGYRRCRKEVEGRI